MWSCGGELQACVRRGAARLSSVAGIALEGPQGAPRLRRAGFHFRPRKKRGDGAPQGAFRLMSALSAFALSAPADLGGGAFRELARLPALRLWRFLSPGPRFLGRGLSGQSQSSELLAEGS